MPVEDRWLSVDDLREYLGVSRDTIYDWLNAKNLPGHKVGRLWKFKRKEVDEWVRAGSAAERDSPSVDTVEVSKTKKVEKTSPRQRSRQGK